MMRITYMTKLNREVNPYILFNFRPGFSLWPRITQIPDADR